MRDQELLDRLARRDPEALDQLRLTYTPLIRYIIAPILPDERDREECLSDVLMKVWNRAETYDGGKASFPTWLSALARNTALNHLRASARHGDSLPLDSGIPDAAGDPAELLLRQERGESLRRALGGLSDRERDLFLRKYYYYQTTAQIAAELGLSPRAVEGCLRRIRKDLQKKLGGDRHD